MAEEYQEYKTEQQSNINFNESFKMGVKAPLVADRIFETYAMADAYVKDQNSSAVAGLTLSVISDPNTDIHGVSLNGIYQVVASTTERDPIYHKPVLYLTRASSVQSDWWDDDLTSLAHIKHKPTTDYGCFTINPDGTVTETPYAEGYMD